MNNGRKDKALERQKHSKLIILEYMQISQPKEIGHLSPFTCAIFFAKSIDAWCKHFHLLSYIRLSAIKKNAIENHTVGMGL